MEEGIPLPQPVREDYEVVVEGVMRPSRLLPHVLAASDLITRSDAMAAKIEMAGFGVARYSLPWTKVTATATSLRLEFDDERSYDLVLDLITSLPRVETQISAETNDGGEDTADESEAGPPIENLTAIEIARHAHCPAATSRTAYEVLVDLVNRERLSGSLSPKGLSRLSFEIEAGELEVDVARVTAEPSRNKDAWLYLAMAVEWRLQEGAAPGSSPLLERVARNWARAIDTTDRVLQDLLKDLSPLWGQGDASRNEVGPDAG